ncbi:uncharacterized protein MEPE_05515 [Melanopsichium pennsylvanicum]|uniref:Uncharacterized protein n=1 Tax=Melanopsichium pennsylvanicum TaxID=63383 RepID=A0AAJ5C7D7_9BASI|nr:uncharacterized protein MEPE_05515 [Melanopsichium pennsylvanicum]
MTNNLSRLARTPEPREIGTNEDGALPEELPLILPRRKTGSMTVIITSRDAEKKVTSYEIRGLGAKGAAHCKNDTCNERILNISDPTRHADRDLGRSRGYRHEQRYQV